MKSTPDHLQIMVNERILSESVKRCIILSFVFAIAAILYGFTSIEFLRRYDPSIFLWDNIWPRIVFNALPFALLGVMIRYLDVSNKKKLTAWVYGFNMVFFATACVHVWPTVLKGHAELINFVNTANVFVITMVFIIAAPPLRQLIHLTFAVLLIFIVPFIYVLFQSGDRVVLKACGSDIIMYLFLNILAAKFLNNLHARVATLEIEKEGKAEEALQKERDYSEGIVNNTPAIICSVSPKGLINFINPAGEKAIGRKGDDLVGNDFRGVFVNSNKTKDADRYLSDVDKVNLVNFELPMPTRDFGGRTISWTLSKSFDVAGQISEIIGFGIDVTERKKAEEEKQMLEVQLRQAQKLEAIGTLAGGIAHDFNNILLPISVLAEMTMEDVSEDSEAHENLKEVLQGTFRARNLVKQILAFSRHGDHEETPLKLQLVIKEALKLIRSSLPTTIEIRQDIAKECGFVMADPTQIHQVVMNLCTNAYHAMQEEGGVLKVGIAELDMGPDDFTGININPGPYVCLTVSDNGKGIEREIKDRIFDPYFTTKDKGRGTGLGLSVVHGIVKDCGGDIRVNSELGKGTEFEVYFPRIEPEADKTEAISVEPAPKGTERLLFVDDDDKIVNTVHKMFHSLGYRITALTNSLEALKEFQSQPDNYDIVITDMTMPNMRGDQLAQKLMEIRPDIPVILLTGFSELITEEKAMALGFKGYILKPPLMHEMAKSVRKVLDET